MRIFSVLILLLVSGVTHADGFNLAPGEILIAVNGVPVSQTSQNVPSVKASVVSSGMPAMAQSANSLVVNRDPVAYAHALREAQIIASRGENYHRSGDGGHPLGVAPGCRYAGTGYSRDPNRPNHCYLGEMPESRLIVRAMVPGPNGTYFWSAHYR